MLQLEEDKTYCNATACKDLLILKYLNVYWPIYYHDNANTSGDSTI